MSQNQLGENIARYRKEKGLSQEKVAEHMGVSRQAVTKWESNISKPSSENLMKLAKLFGVSVDVLLDNDECKNVSDETTVTTSKSSWIFIGCSIIFLIAYVIISSWFHMFRFGTLICMFVICIPIQMFLHIYFSNAINQDSFSGIAGFDEKTEYHIVEVKKMLAQMDLQIGMLSTVFVFLLCTLNCANLKIPRLDVNGLLLGVYTLDFMATIIIDNYRSVDKIYCNEEDKKRAVRSMPVAVVYILLLFTGIGITAFLFETKGIENNTVPAMKLSGLCLLGILLATIGLFVENKNLKKWNPDMTTYKINKVSVASLVLCLIVYGLMCIL